MWLRLTVTQQLDDVIRIQAEIQKNNESKVSNIHTTLFLQIKFNSYSNYGKGKHLILTL